MDRQEGEVKGVRPKEAIALSDNAALTERLDKVGKILEDEIYIIADRTARLADALTDLLPDSERARSGVAYQIEANCEEICRLIFAAFDAGWPKADKEATA